MSADGSEREAKSEAERLGIEYVPVQMTEQLDFSVPEGVEPFWIEKTTGAKQSEGHGFLEYFIKGTEPEESPVIENDDESTGEESASSYLESPDL
jgi:membrane carboxypeptidase/penicillin-binding protein